MGNKSKQRSDKRHQSEEESALLHDARLALTDAFDLDELRLAEENVRLREVLGRVTNELELPLGGPRHQSEEESALLHDARLALTDAFDLDELRLHRLHIDGAGVEMEVSSQKVVQGLAALMARTLDDLGAKNYVQQELSLSTSEFVLLVQRRAGKTPHTLRLEAEAERDDLKKRLAAADEQLRIFTNSGKDFVPRADLEAVQTHCNDVTAELHRQLDELRAKLAAAEQQAAAALRERDAACRERAGLLAQLEAVRQGEP